MVLMVPIALESVPQTVRRVAILTGSVAVMQAGWVSIVAQVSCMCILVLPLSLVAVGAMEHVLIESVVFQAVSIILHR